jgi:hypothetical protein
VPLTQTTLQWGLDVPVSFICRIEESDVAWRNIRHDDAIVFQFIENSLNRWPARLVADGLSIQDRFLPKPRYKQTGKGVYRAKTVTEIRRAKKIKKGRGLDGI